MQKIASLILDQYDDADRSFLKSSYVDQGWEPEHLDGFLKMSGAQIFTRDELDRLPDETFAVILEQDGLSLRKYSMADRGNTAVSAVYFAMLGGQLSKEAQQVAAENLFRGFEMYDIHPPSMLSERLTKVALGLGTLAMGALTVPGVAQEAKGNLQATRGAGSQILTPEQIKMRRLQMGVQQ